MTGLKHKLNLCYFSDNKAESGQIGIPSEKDAEELLRAVMNEGNIRELMTMCMNFYKDGNKVGICKHIFQLMLDVKLDSGKNTRFTNLTNILKRILEIERILGFDITKTNAHTH